MKIVKKLLLVLLIVLSLVACANNKTEETETNEDKDLTQEKDEVILDIEELPEKEEIIEQEESIEEEVDITQMKFWVVFFNEDGVALQRTAMKYGSIPSYEGEEPIYWDSKYWYRFIGWADKDGNMIDTFKPIYGNTYFYAKYEVDGRNKPKQDSNSSSDDPLECLASGTLITLANGKQKLIEELEVGDEVRTFDHTSGKKSSSKIIDLWLYEETKGNAFTLHFSNDINVKVVGGHCFYEKESNKYVNIKHNNVDNYIGHHFYNLDNDLWEELKSVTYHNEKVDTYIIVTDKQFNCVAEGMLSNEDGIYYVLCNIFDFDSNMKIDAKKKQEDIKKYGLWDFEEANYVTKETYDSLNLKYLSVAVGKGLISKEMIEKVGAYSATFDTDFIREEVKGNNLEKSR